MLENFFAQIVFDQARHDDNGLPHEIHKDAHDEGQEQDQAPKKQERYPQNTKKCGLRSKAFIELVQTNVVDHQIECLADNARLKYAKIITQGYKDEAQQKPPAVLVKIFIEKG